MFRPIRAPNPYSLRRVLQSALVITSFNQSLGAEILVNGDLALWTGDNPNSWTVVGESGSDPMITQVAPNGSAGTGAARYYRSGAVTLYCSQSSGLVTGNFYEGRVFLSVRTAANALVNIGAQHSYSVAGDFYTLDRATIAAVAFNGQGGPPVDYVLDGLSVKLITPNPNWTMPSADGTHTFTFALPATPYPEMRIEMRYRRQDDLNYWVAYLQRNTANSAWNFRLDSVNAGTATNRVNVSGVGTPDAVRVVTSGNSHTAYTGSGGTYTQRGTQQTNSLHAAQTGIAVLYNSPFTPSELRSTPA